VRARTNVYLQMSFREFVENFPDIAEDLKDMPLYEHFLTDPLYVVRVGDGNKIEIGYKEDAWHIK